MGRIRVGPQAIREYLGRMRERYAHAARPTKGQLLDEVCEVTGYHRKAVIRSLRRPPIIFSFAIRIPSSNGFLSREPLAACG